MQSNKVIKNLGLFATIIILVGLTGCTSAPKSPSVSYYLLDQASQPIAPKQTTRSVAITPVVVAEYLSVPNLLLKQTDHRIILANYHLWAEPLPPSIKRAIMSDLTTMKPNISIVDQCLNCDLLRIYIDHFYPEEEGDVVLAGRYTIERVNGQQENYPFSHKSFLTTSGYAAAVEQMRALLETLSQQIANQL